MVNSLVYLHILGSMKKGLKILKECSDHINSILEGAS